MESALGVVGHPLRFSPVESLAEVLLRFRDGRSASLFAHISTAPMSPLPFFQLFGDKVSGCSLPTSLRGCLRNKRFF